MENPSARIYPFTISLPFLLSAMGCPSAMDPCTTGELASGTCENATLQRAWEAGHAAGKEEAGTALPDDVEQRLAAMEALIATYEDRLSTAEGRIEELESAQGDALSIEDVEATVAEATVDVVRLVGTEVWEVSSPEELATRLVELEGRRIETGATITIELAPGVYAYDQSIHIGHPDGERLRIVGDPLDPSMVELTFSGSSGFVIEEGSGIGYLAGITLTGDATTVADGLLLEPGAYAGLGPLVIRQFGNAGLSIWGGAYAELVDPATDGWLTVSGCGGNGIHLGLNSAAYLPSIRVEDNAGRGIVITQSSYAVADSATAEGNGLDGFMVATWGAATFDGGISSFNGTNGVLAQTGYVDAVGVLASGNSQHGFTAYTGVMSAGGSTADSNGWAGFVSHLGSYMNASGTIAQGNAWQGYRASTFSGIYANGAASSGGGNAYSAFENSYIFAQGATGEVTVETAYHDTCDWIYGIGC